jgi:chromosome segregation ATPase
MTRLVDKLIDGVDDILNNEFSNQAQYIIENDEMKKKIERLEQNIRDFYNNEMILKKEVNSLLMEKRTALLEVSDLTQKLSDISGYYKHELLNSSQLNKEIKDLKINIAKTVSLYSEKERETDRLANINKKLVVEIKEVITKLQLAII